MGRRACTDATSRFVSPTATMRIALLEDVPLTQSAPGCGGGSGESAARACASHGFKL